MPQFHTIKTRNQISESKRKQLREHPMTPIHKDRISSAHKQRAADVKTAMEILKQMRQETN